MLREAASSIATARREQSQWQGDYSFANSVSSTVLSAREWLQWMWTRISDSSSDQAHGRGDEASALRAISAIAAICRLGGSRRCSHSLDSPLLEPALPALIDDFYEEIERHPETRQVITGGQPQVKRLKGTLIRWLHELLSGPYDADYVERRWRVGHRHVEIGLEQVFTNAALSRLRTGLNRILSDAPETPELDVRTATQSLNRLLDLDLAIIEDAYQTEFALRQQRIERLAAIGQIAGGVAHEVRNPLNVIKTSVYYLLNAGILR